MGNLDLHIPDELITRLFGNERLCQYREWESQVEEKIREYPFPFQIMFLRGIPVPRIEEYQENPPVISSHDRHDLLSLNGADLANDLSSIVDDEELIRNLKRLTQELPFSMKEERTIIKAGKNVPELFEGMRNLATAGFAILSGRILGICPEYVSQFNSGFTDYLKDFLFKRTPTAARVRDYFLLIKKNLRGSTDPVIRKSLDITVDFADFQILNKYFDLRLAREKGLRAVNPDFANAYFGYNAIMQCGIETVLDWQPTFPEAVVEFSNLARFIRLDNELYNDMVRTFRTLPEPEPAYKETPVRQPAPRKLDLPSTPNPEPVYEPTPQDELKYAIVRGKENDFSKDSLARVGYFVFEDTELYNGRLGELTDSFLKFNLPRRMRNRETRPDELQFRNFFDDVCLNYVRAGRVPTPNDLERLYHENCKVSG